VIRLSGRFRSALVIGMQGIRARKTRTLLSMVSLFLGVLAVVVVQAGAEVAKQAALADIELHRGKDGTRQIYVPPTANVMPIVLDTLRGKSNGVAVLSTQTIIGEPGVRPINDGGRNFDDLASGPIGPVGPISGPEGSVLICDARGMCFERGPDLPEQQAPPGQAIELQLTAMTGDIRQFRPYRMQAGQWLDFASAPSLAPRIVINKAAAKGFGRYPVPAEMRIDGATANATPRIIGVVDDGSGQPTAYVRADELLNWLSAADLANGRGPGLEVLLAPGSDDLERLLRTKLVAGGVRSDELHTEVIRSKEEIEEQLAIVRLVFLGMAGLVLLIGVAGILNVGLATVGERVEEFALRRAVGTPRVLLAGIVLAETLLTGLFTAALAILVASQTFEIAVTLFGDQQQFLRQVSFPWQAGVAGVIAGLVAGTLGGLIPALRAARIPIASVMRA
jgi:putative ABC transport system permease protein